METYQSENTLQRFKTFWLTLGVMLLFALAGAVAHCSSAPKSAITSAADEKRLATLAEVRDAQAKAVTDLGLIHRDPQGGHLTSVAIPDALLKKSVAHLQEAAKAASALPTPNKTEQVIPNSKTFNEQQQSKGHDPAESEFLK